MRTEEAGQELKGGQGLLPQEQVRAEKRAGRLYFWLLFSPFITFPIFFWYVFSSSDPDPASAVLISSPPHLVLLFGVASGHLFVRRHAQQALLLAGLRVGSSFFFLGVLEGECLLLSWLMINTVLWLGGSVWGWWQVRQGKCWLMTQRPDEAHLVPRPWAPGPATAVSANEWRRRPYQQPKPQATPANAAGPAPDLAPREALTTGKALAADRPAAAVNYLAHAFRQGSPHVRLQAEAALQALGQVELF